MPTRAMALVVVLISISMSACGGPAAAPPSSPSPPAPAPAKPASDKPEAKPAPSVKFQRLDGSAFGIEDLPGDVKVVNFWATWCKPCIQELPSFNKMHAKYGSKGVTIVGISIDEGGAADVERFLKTPKGKIDYQIGLARLADLGSLGVTESIPVTLIFNRAGKQVKRFDAYTEEKDLEAAITGALAGG